MENVIRVCKVVFDGDIVVDRWEEVSSDVDNVLVCGVICLDDKESVKRLLGVKIYVVELI